MQRLLAFLSVSTLIFAIGACAVDQPNAPTGPVLTTQFESGAQSYSELLAAGTDFLEFFPDLSAHAPLIGARDVGTSTLQVFTDRASFSAFCPVLVSEDLENSSFPPVSVGKCAGPIDAATGGSGCYPVREVQPGLAMDNRIAGNDPSGLAVITGGGPGQPYGQLGNVNTIAGADFFADDTHFTFSPGVNSVGLMMFVRAFPETWDFNYFSASGLAGTVNVGGGYVGVFSSVPIVRVEVVSAGGGPGGELFMDVDFGACKTADVIVVPRTQDATSATFRAEWTATGARYAWDVRPVLKQFGANQFGEVSEHAVNFTLPRHTTSYQAQFKVWEKLSGGGYNLLGSSFLTVP